MMCSTAACVLKRAHSLATAAQYGLLPLHVAAEFEASEAVVAALLAAYSGGAKVQAKVRPPLLHTTFCDDV